MRSILISIALTIGACDKADTYHVTYEGDEADIYNDFDITVVEADDEEVNDTGSDSDTDVDTDTDEDTDFPSDPGASCAPYDGEYPILPGRPIKGTSLSTIYYYFEGWRYVFPNEAVYRTWYPADAPIEIMTDSRLASIPLAGNMTVRPGTIAVKITSSQKVYWVVEGETFNAGKLRWIESEGVAWQMFGENWNQFILDIPDVLFEDFDGVGPSIPNNFGLDVDYDAVMTAAEVNCGAY